MFDLLKISFGAKASIAALATGLAAIAFFGADAFRSSHTKSTVAAVMTGGNADRAPPIFRKYGCAGCHTIPGIPGADGQTGAPLMHLSKRVYIAGVLENRPDNLVAWIVSPQALSPQTAMPNTGIKVEEARDLAAYLYAR